MASRPPSPQRARLAQETRERFVADAGRAMTEIAGAAQERLSVLVNEAAPSREMQVRRDAWTFFQRARTSWRDATVTGWQKALLPVEATAQAFAKSDLQDIDALQLVGTDVVENRILASRLVLRVMDKVSSERDDLRLRIRGLEHTEELDRNDILRPEALVLLLIEQWAGAGMPSGSWPLVNDVVQTLLAERLNQAYHKANQFLIESGVMPTIEFKDRVRRAAAQPSAARAFPSTRPTAEPGPRGDHHDGRHGDPGGEQYHISGFSRQGRDAGTSSHGGYPPGGMPRASGGSGSGPGGAHADAPRGSPPSDRPAAVVG